MHCSRLVGGLAALGGAPHPLRRARRRRCVSAARLVRRSTRRAAATASRRSPPAPAAPSTPPVTARRDAPAPTARLLLVKYVDTGATMTRGWVVQSLRRRAPAASKVAVDPSGRRHRRRHPGAEPSTGKGSDIIVLKYSPAGELRWKATYDGPAHRDGLRQRPGARRPRQRARSRRLVRRGTGRDYVTLKFRANGSRRLGPSLRRTRGVRRGAQRRRRSEGQRLRHRLVQRQEPARGARRRLAYSPAGAKRWAVRESKARAWSGAAAVMFSDVAGARSVVVSGYRGDSGNTGDESLWFAKYRASDGKTVWQRTSRHRCDGRARGRRPRRHRRAHRGRHEQPGMEGSWPTSRRLGERWQRLEAARSPAGSPIPAGPSSTRSPSAPAARTGRRLEAAGEPAEELRLRPERLPRPLQPERGRSRRRSTTSAPAARPAGANARRSPSARSACTRSDEQTSATGDLDAVLVKF